MAFAFCLTEAMTTMVQAPTAAPSFEFPTLYNFPPFFTQQPNAQTSESQNATWCKLILDYCQAKRKFFIDAASEEDLNSELFYNKRIDRRASQTFAKALLGRLVAQGAAAWDGKKAKGEQPTRAIIYWKRPEQWGELIYEWVSALVANV